MRARDIAVDNVNVGYLENRYCVDTEAIQPGGVTFGRGFKESAVVSLTVSRS